VTRKVRSSTGWSLQRDAVASRRPLPAGPLRAMTLHPPQGLRSPNPWRWLDADRIALIVAWLLPGGEPAPVGSSRRRRTAGGHDDSHLGKFRSRSLGGLEVPFDFAIRPRRVRRNVRAGDSPYVDPDTISEDSPAPDSSNSRRDAPLAICAPPGIPCCRRGPGLVPAPRARLVSSPAPAAAHLSALDSRRLRGSKPHVQRSSTPNALTNQSSTAPVGPVARAARRSLERCASNRDRCLARCRDHR
jgi:hypothetical protein